VDKGDIHRFTAETLGRAKKETTCDSGIELVRSLSALCVPQAIEVSRTGRPASFSPRSLTIQIDDQAPKALLDALLFISPGRN